MQQHLVDEVSTAARRRRRHTVVVAAAQYFTTLLHTWLDGWLADHDELVGIIDLEHVDRGVVEPPAQAPQRFMAHDVRQR